MSIETLIRVVSDICDSKDLYLETKQEAITAITNEYKDNHKESAK